MEPSEHPGAPANLLLRLAFALFDYYLFVPLCAAGALLALQAFRLNMRHDHLAFYTEILFPLGAVSSVLVWNVRYARTTLKAGAEREPWWWYGALLTGCAFMTVVWILFLALFYGDVSPLSRPD